MHAPPDPTRPGAAHTAPSPAELETLRRSHRRRLSARIALTVAFVPLCIFVCPPLVEVLGYTSGLALPVAWGVVFALYAAATWRLWRCSRCGRGLSLSRADWGLRTCGRCGIQLR